MSLQVCRLVCDFLQTMISESPALLHLLLRQMLPTDALVLLLDGVRVSRARALPGILEAMSCGGKGCHRVGIPGEDCVLLPPCHVVPVRNSDPCAALIDQVLRRVQF